MTTKRAGILTGGADEPGLNSVTRSAVYRGNKLDCRVEGPGAARRSS